MPIEKAFKKRFDEEKNLSVDVQELAHAIRNEILAAKRNKLPSNLSVNNEYQRKVRKIVKIPLLIK